MCRKKGPSNVSIFQRALAVTSTLAIAITSLVVLAQPADAAIAAPALQWSKTDLGAVVESSPNVANVAGGMSVLVGSRSGYLHMQNAANGADRPGFAKNLENPIDASPAVADVDFDGTPDIFAGSGVAAKEAGDLWRIGPDGQTSWRYHPRDNDFPNLSMFSSPALGDVNGDGYADVSGFSLGLLGWSFSNGGPLNKGWPFYQDDTIFSSPAIADVDGDGRQDYVVGGDSSAGPPVDHQGGMLRAIRGDGSEIWNFKTDDIVRSSPVVGDLDNDGQIEIVFGCGYYYYDKTGHTNDAMSVFALNKNGQLKWRKDLGGFTPSSPAIADINGDGKREVLMTTWNGTSRSGIRDKTIFALNSSTGEPLPGWNAKDLRFGSSLGQPVTADFNNDGAQDVLVASGGGIAAYNGPDGAELFALNEGQNVAYQNSPWLGDVDGDGLLDVIAAGQHATNHNGVLQRWEFTTNTARPGVRGWNQFRGDSAHSGNVVGSSMGTNYCNGVPSANGYLTYSSDGGAFGFCGAFHGSMGGKPLNGPIVGAARKPDGSGYWEVGADGGIFSFGNAVFKGSMGGSSLNKPIVAMATTPSGNGYWLVASDGGIFAYGDATFQGSMGGKPLNSPIVGMASNNTNTGYWLVAADGGIFAFGSAGFKGSMGGKPLNKPIVGIAAHPTGSGYWMVASDGGVFSFGVDFYGSMGGKPLNSPIVGMHAVGNGYRFVAADGGIFSYNLPFYGSTGAYYINKPVIAIG